MPTIITAHVISTDTNSATVHGLSTGASMPPIPLTFVAVPSPAGMLIPAASHRT